jgi:hypothetical protein
MLTSPGPRWRTPTSPWWCCSLCMQSSSEALPPAAMLLWTDSLPYCAGLLYRPAMLKMSKTLAATKYRRPPKIHWFSPNYINLYLCSQASYQKVVKTKIIITVQYQFLLLRPSVVHWTSSRKDVCGSRCLLGGRDATPPLPCLDLGRWESAVLESTS